DGRRGTADDARGEPVDHRRGAVDRLVLLGFGDARAQPAGAHTVHKGRFVPPRQVHHDRARLVQAAGLVAADRALHPVLAVPRLPDQRRPLRVDADSVDATAEVQPHGALRYRVGQSQVERVVGYRTGLEGREGRVDAQLLRVVDGRRVTGRLAP